MPSTRKIVLILGGLYGALQWHLYRVASGANPIVASPFAHHRGLRVHHGNTAEATPTLSSSEASTFGVGVSTTNSNPLSLRREAGAWSASLKSCSTSGDSAACNKGIHHRWIQDRTDQQHGQDSFDDMRENLRASGLTFSLSKSPKRTISFKTHRLHGPYNETLPLKLRPAIPNDNRIIYFLHIHKAAGTRMCETARVNKINVTNTNCNVQKDQRCCGGNDSLQAQRQYAQRTTHGLVANERDMYMAMDPLSYRYVVVLRQSRARYRSHWKNMCREYNDTSTTFQSWWTRQPDNWIVRKICGTKCMGVPKYQITKELFEYALARLRLFEDILFTERFDETYNTFANHVGWSAQPPEIPTDNASFPYAQDPATDDQWDPLMSALDDALYDFAEGLYDGVEQPPHLSGKSRLKIQKYWMEGPGHMCRSECCHAECSTY